MEALLQYVWKHRMFASEGLRTTDGRGVEVVAVGVQNTDGGPDFWNARVRIEGVLLAGSVEIHSRSRDWYVHGHDKDKAYDGVALHVVEVADCDVRTTTGRVLPQLAICVPENLEHDYEDLRVADRRPPCYSILDKLPPIMVRGWLERLQVERLERKTADALDRLRLRGGDWAGAYFATLARGFGFGVNGDAFELWGIRVPLNQIAHHLDDPFQVEAMFLGLAGLLDLEAMDVRRRTAACGDPYFTRIRDEWEYLRHKFSMEPVAASVWRFLRLRPQGFPHIRISQLARLHGMGHTALSCLLDCKSVDDVLCLYATESSDYWLSHYAFGMERKSATRKLSKGSLRLLAVNVAAPVAFAYGRHNGDRRLCQRALDWLECLPAESNHIINMWRECGIDAGSAGDSQALVQLKTRYCDPRECLRCRFGYEFIRRERTLPKLCDGGE